VAGSAGRNALIGAPQGQCAGLTFTAGGPAGAEPVAVGFDVAEPAPDGRIRPVLGFIDKAPAM
jgi:hypothetical protein